MAQGMGTKMSIDFRGPYPGVTELLLYLKFRAKDYLNTLYLTLSNSLAIFCSDKTPIALSSLPVFSQVGSVKAVFGGSKSQSESLLS